MFKISKQNREKEVLFRRNILFLACIVMFILYFEKISYILGWIFTICMPFILGAVFAFVFNTLANGIMHMASLFFHWKETKSTRNLCNVLAILIVLMICSIFMFIILPRLFLSIESIIRSIPQATYQIFTWLQDLTKDWPSLHASVLEMEHTMNQDGGVAKWLEDVLNWFVSGGANGLFDSVYQVISTTFSFVFSTFVSLMFSIILLFNKKRFVMEMHALLKAYLTDIAYENTMHVVHLVKRTFTSYLGGTCTECLILGSLVMLGASIFHIPYALLSGVLVMIGALVPMFGALIAACIAALFIVFESPIHALYFLIMFICIQQVEGNFIYPHVVGKSVGFPPMYVIIAVTIGANVAGALGMVLFIPICSCIYQLIKEDALIRLKKKQSSQILIDSLNTKDD